MSAADNIEKLAEAIEDYCSRVSSQISLECTPQIMAPSSQADIGKLEKKLSLALPDDVKNWWRRGLKAICASNIGEPSFTLGFDFIDAKSALKHTEMLRKVAKDTEAENGWVVLKGVALTYSEPELIVCEGAVYHFSFRNPLLRVTDDFTTFIAHYLYAGCFCSHDFSVHWAAVSKVVPKGIPIKKNLWVTAYKKQYGGLSEFVKQAGFPTSTKVPLLPPPPITASQRLDSSPQTPVAPV